MEPMRVLQVVGGMNHGGAETWLMNVLRRVDRNECKMDFLVHTEKPGLHDAEIRDLGSKVIQCLQPHQPVRYAINFRRAVRENGPYDIIHSHVHYFSGYVLWLAKIAGVTSRVMHVHSALTESGVAWSRAIYTSAMQKMIGRCATRGLACSKSAAYALWGPNWRRDPRWETLYCGVDADALSRAVDRKAVRAEFGIEQDAVVLGHVGRFEPVKNHPFILQVAKAFMADDASARLVLVGNGPTRNAAEELASDIGIADKVRFVGARSDVPRLMRGLFDCIVMPSFYEGLPLVLLEAQAAGVSCVASSAVTAEVECVPGLVDRLGLDLPVAEWVMGVRKLLHRRKQIGADAALQYLRESPFSLENSIKALTGAYEREVRRGSRVPR